MFATTLCQFSNAQEPSVENIFVEASKQFDSAFSEASCEQLAELFTDDIVINAGAGKWISLQIVNGS